MKVKWIIMAVAGLGSGCTAEAAAPTESVPAVVAVDVAHAPPSSGPRVVRISGVPNAFHLTDPEKGWSVVYGIDIIAACQGGASLDLMDIQLIQGTANVDRVHALLTGADMVTSVWPFADEAIDCAKFTTIEPIGVGRSDLRITDNDLSAVLNHNVNTFGYKAQGVVIIADGSSARFSAVTRCVYRGTLPPDCTDHIHVSGL